MKGDKMNVEMVLFLASIVLCVSCGFFWFSKSDEETKPVDSTNRLTDKLNYFIKDTQDSLARLSERLIALEQPKEQSSQSPPKALVESYKGTLHFDRPIQVEIIGGGAAGGGGIPPQISGQKALLKKAGIK